VTASLPAFVIRPSASARFDPSSKIDTPRARCSPGWSRTSRSWIDEVTCYVKNQGLSFTIQYTLSGESRQYVPDFIVRAKPDLNLMVEVSGEAKKDKAAKVATARTLWVPAVNNHGGFGRWAFVEVTDPWDAKGVVKAAIAEALAACSL
jgi:hypothetical protein